MNRGSWLGLALLLAAEGFIGCAPAGSPSAHGASEGGGGGNLGEGGGAGAGGGSAGVGAEAGTAGPPEGAGGAGADGVDPVVAPDAGVADAALRIDGPVRDATVGDLRPYNPGDAGPGLLVAVGYTSTLTSTDGKTWSNLRSWTLRGHGLSSVAYGSGRFVAAGSGGPFCEGCSWISSTTDGVNWTDYNRPGTGWLGTVARGNGLFAVASSDGTVLSSPDGLAWKVEATATGVPNRVVLFGAGVFVALGGPGVYWSADLKTWTAVTLAGFVPERGGFRNGRFYVFSKARVAHSGDGKTWSTPIDLTGADITGVAAAGASVYLGAEFNGWMSDNNGATWTKIDNRDSPGPMVEAFGLAIGFRGNRMLYSDNGCRTFKAAVIPAMVTGLNGLAFGAAL